MFPIIAERLRQKYRTVAYPAKEPVLSPRFRGMPELAAQPHAADLAAAIAACPTGALHAGASGSPILDMGRCLFCGACERASSSPVVTFGGSHRLAALQREDLLRTPQTPPVHDPDTDTEENAKRAGDAIRRLFKRSFRIRQVSAAGCNACEADCNVLTTVVFDLARFGIDFVASPRHADAVLVTGPVPRNMQSALMTCYEAMPHPKAVIAVGACAISGGLFRELDQDGRGVTPHLPVDLFIPGCPPSPYTILHGLLLYLERERG